MRLLFVRHAESQGNVEARLQGHADFRLSERGRRQAAALRDRLGREGLAPTHVYSSPLLRSAETARIVAAEWGPEIVPWDDLKETQIGIFSGLTWAEIESAHPETARRFLDGSGWDVVEGAESFDQRRARGRRVVDAVIERHGDEDVVVLFTHGGILQYMVAALLETERSWGTSVENTALFEFVFDRGRWMEEGALRHNPREWRIVRFNDASHLGLADSG